jgi:hypothetical protein
MPQPARRCNTVKLVCPSRMPSIASLARWLPASRCHGPAARHVLPAGSAPHRADIFEASMDNEICAQMAAAGDSRNAAASPARRGPARYAAARLRRDAASEERPCRRYPRRASPGSASAARARRRARTVEHPFPHAAPSCRHSRASLSGLLSRLARPLSFLQRGRRRAGERAPQLSQPGCSCTAPRREAGPR